MTRKTCLMLTAASLLAAVHPAAAHGIAGERVFPATMAIDDPAVSDELTLPQARTFREREDDGGTTRVDEYSAEYSKRITNDFGLSLEGAYVDGEDGARGWDNIGINAKYQLFRSDAHEMLGAVGLGWDIGGTGSHQVAESFSSLSPQFYIGKGFGDLPDSVEWLKPFALTGSAALELPLRGGESKVLHTGFSLQYSIPYLQQHVKDIGLGAPFNNVVPVVEFTFDSPLDHTDSHQTTGTINPGILWTGQGVQMGVEAILPLNHDSGQGVGVTANLHFYLDDLLPASLGRPVFR